MPVVIPGQQPYQKQNYGAKLVSSNSGPQGGVYAQPGFQQKPPLQAQQPLPKPPLQQQQVAPPAGVPTAGPNFSGNYLGNPNVIAANTGMEAQTRDLRGLEMTPYTPPMQDGYGMQSPDMAARQAQAAPGWGDIQQLLQMMPYRGGRGRMPYRGGMSY